MAVCTGVDMQVGASTYVGDEVKHGTTRMAGGAGATGQPLLSYHIKKSHGAPGWRSRLSVRLQPGHDLAVSSSPASGSGLMAWSLEPVSDSVSPSLSAPPLFMLCLSVPKINKR